MNTPSRAILALIITAGVALFLFWFIYSNYTVDLKWLPQTVVTLAGLVGASWFAGHRLDLLDKDIGQRQTAASAQLTATERGNFNGAIKEAVTMMVDKSSLSASLAGQRWLYTIASIGPTEANLVQALLCNHITTSPSDPKSASNFQLKSRQAALHLLFHSTEKTRFADCTDVPNLGATPWAGFDFTDLDASSANFADGDFTGAVIVRANFDNCDLCGTKWSKEVGGNSRTSMCRAKFYGAEGSSCVFTNVDFAAAEFRNNGFQKTLFRHCTFEQCNFAASDWSRATFEHCTFKQCDFSGAIWNHVTLIAPTFDLCPKITFDLCKTLKKLTRPTGLPYEFTTQLEEMEIMTD